MPGGQLAPAEPPWAAQPGPHEDLGESLDGGTQARGLLWKGGGVVFPFSGEGKRLRPGISAPGEAVLRALGASGVRIPGPHRAGFKGTQALSAHTILSARASPHQFICTAGYTHQGLRVPRGLCSEWESAVGRPGGCTPDRRPSLA